MTFVAFLSDDQIISASDEDMTVRQWTVSDGGHKVVREVVPCAVAMSPNKRWVAIGGRDGRVRLLDPQAPTEVKRTEIGRHADVIKSLSFSPDSSQLASGAQDGTMLIWSSATLMQVADGKKIASCDREVIQIWDSTSATWIGMAINEPAWSLAWSSDGNCLFVGCLDGTIKRYNPDTGAVRASHMGHRNVVSSIAVSHNANFVATASWDKTVRLWEATTFQPIGPILLHDAHVYSISISPDDSQLVSGARDPKVRVWNLRSIAPTLFNFFPLEPNRGLTKNTNAFHLPWVKPIRDPESPSDDQNDPQTPNTHLHVHTEKSEGSAESGDLNPANSPSKRARSIRSIFGRKREQGDTIDYPRTPSPSTQGSGSSYTEEETPRSTSSPYFPPTPSPTRSRRHVSESENERLIREIRSNSSHDLTGSIVPEGKLPVSGGSHGDIYRGTLNVNGRTMRVAIKVIKKYLAQGDDQSKQRRLRREIKLWLKLDHKNVIPLLGTTENYGDFPAMVCPWAENGILTDYLDRCNNDLTPPLRFCIINDVALGLQYLHSKSIVHGDVSGSNILIYGSGRACVSDFGLSMVTSDINESSVALTYQVKATIRWTAPELLNLREHDENEDDNPPKIFPTVHSDIYSFAGIMLHVLSGKRPYHNFSRDEQVILAVSRGEHPKRPTSSAVIIMDDQWDFMMKCWSYEVTERPSDSDMVAFVHEQLIDAVTAASQRESMVQIPLRSETLRGDEGC
ncbi:kinase-like domain-containing protein [Boletus reticuloceps]|uniref:Kinase-like domain-containing protein n=1 Tax=Boletus reticuloceps TaxID=495285 RepID=A0A8I3AAI1_9AGAM|nr:kinase-like domain-containing protein [Boletus reticuloceps]